jgi:hypothetical protein
MRIKISEFTNARPRPEPAWMQNAVNNTGFTHISAFVICLLNILVPAQTAGLFHKSRNVFELVDNKIGIR